MLHYHIHTIPHAKHRFPTCGDYWDEGVHTEVRISSLPDPRMEFCVLMHELFEHFSTKMAGIDEETQILPFDLEYERNRPDGDVSEPGDDPRAPYHIQHIMATEIEKLVAEKLGLLWDDYTKVIEYL